MHSRDALAHIADLDTDADQREPGSRYVAVPPEEELRRFLSQVREGEPGTLDLSWQGLSPSEPGAETGSPAVSLRDYRQRAAESHAPELVRTVAVAQRLPFEAPGRPGDGAASAAETSALTAEVRDLERRLQMSERASSSHEQRVRELELEQSTVLRTAEYLEAQRASLATEVQEAWAAHERNEQTRLAIEGTLSDERAIHAVEMSRARQDADRLGRRLEELEAAHAETVALSAALQIEVGRLRAQIEDTHAAADTERGRLEEQASALDEALAESARLGEMLKGALTDLEDLGSWARAKSARLAETVRHGKRAADR